MKGKQVHKVLVVCLLVFLFSGCTEEVFYEKSYSFKDNTWSQHVKPMFKVEIKDTTIAYNFTITLRNTTDYGFSNCWIYLNTKTPNKEKAREPFQIHITNPDGTWVGNKSGTIVENRLDFKSRKFPMPGTYYFQLEQGVVEKELGEVLDVGLRIEPVKQEGK